MKKSIFLIAALFSIAVMVTSCKDSKKEEVKTEEHKGHDHDKENVASGDAYQCPMDCEKGKAYGKQGSCPVCKMDLKKQKGDNDVNHSSTCECKTGGECKCEPGKCQCQTAKECAKCGEGECTCKGKEVAEKAKDCKMCEPGECKCKA